MIRKYIEILVDKIFSLIDNRIIGEDIIESNITEENIMTYYEGDKVKLTQQISGKVVGSSTLKIITHMSVGGGGGRNLIVWSLLASKKGFTDVIIESPDASPEASESIAKAVSYANEMLNHLGCVIRYI